jgi:hypothetical protein
MMESTLAHAESATNADSTVKTLSMRRPLIAVVS